MPVVLGSIADDFTGATDLANTLVREGMRTVQLIGVPSGEAPADVDAVVVALKSRTIHAPDAVSQSLAALSFLRRVAPGRSCSSIVRPSIRPIGATSARSPTRC
jgi:3-dehydrotetronate 4-kinase